MTTIQTRADGRCIGCREYLADDRMDVGYCGQQCRKVARVVEKAVALNAEATAALEATSGFPAEVRELFEAADAKWAAAFELGELIRAEKLAGL